LLKYSFFYLDLDLTIPQENNVTRLQDWINFYKPYCRLIDVPADGMCGWFCLAASSEYLNDYPFLRLDNGTGWKPAAWEKMTVMLNAVVDEVLRACKTLTSRKGDPQATQEAEHLLVGFHPDQKRSKPTAKDRYRYVETTAKKLLKNSASNRPYDLNTWFGNQWGNVAAKVIKRPVVVVGENVGGKENVVFTLHTPRFINGYSFTEFGEGTPRMGGTSYALLMDLKAAIEEVMPDFNESFPPVWLHYNAATSHFNYYSERCPPPRRGCISRILESSDESPSPEPGTIAQNPNPHHDADRVASALFGQVAYNLKGMNAKHHFFYSALEFPNVLLVVRRCS
jgi:hypothetical protein